MKTTNKLRERCREIGLTDRQLSELSGVPFGTINHWIHVGYSKARLSEIAKVAKVLELSLDELALASEGE